MPALSAIGAFAQGADKDRRALSVALDALRKIALNHPCDLHGNIAQRAVASIKEITG